MSLAAFEAVVDSDSTPIDFIIEQIWIWIRVPGWDSNVTHAAVAIGYIFYSILHRVIGAGSISSAWGDVGEMLALALHSDRAG